MTIYKDLLEHIVINKMKNVSSICICNMQSIEICNLSLQCECVLVCVLQWTNILSRFVPYAAWEKTRGYKIDGWIDGWIEDID